MRPAANFLPYVGYFSNFYALLSDEAFLAQEFSKTAYIFYISLVFSLRNTISPADYYLIVCAIGQMLRRWELPSSLLFGGIDVLHDIASLMDANVKRGDNSLHRENAPTL